MSLFTPGIPPLELTDASTGMQFASTDTSSGGVPWWVKVLGGSILGGALGNPAAIPNYVAPPISNEITNPNFSNDYFGFKSALAGFENFLVAAGENVGLFVLAIALIALGAYALIGAPDITIEGKA